MDVDAAGRVWIPEYARNRLARFDPATERFDEWELPVPDALPYVARLDEARGALWIGTGAADALIRFDLATERFTVYPLPTAGALVRHLDVDRRTGAVWLAYGASPSRGPAKVARVDVRE
jgi:virginiamycin B lyase